MRGADHRSVWAGPGCGTIPAGAGSRPAHGWAGAAPRDHPRRCGEQDRGTAPRPPGTGPSPRVRGAGRVTAHDERRVGTIPAGAGSRPPAATSTTRPRDHPRGCGEQAQQGAGHFGAQDHPRGCGEQTFLGCKVISAEGPSPRVRGAVHGGLRSVLVAGTIPAGAGSRASRCPPTPPHGDHPRGCGEQWPAPTVGDSPEGPSPRVRGAVGGGRVSRTRLRTIPAGAGSRLPDLLFHDGESRFSMTFIDSGKPIILHFPHVLRTGGLLAQRPNSMARSEGLLLRRASGVEFRSFFVLGFTSCFLHVLI